MPDVVTFQRRVCDAVSDDELNSSRSYRNMSGPSVEMNDSFTMGVKGRAESDPHLLAVSSFCVQQRYVTCASAS